jgi:PhnB protein
MSNVRLEPYLFFKGNCREAMEFYKGIFGGELAIQALGDVPGDMPGKAEHPDYIMHAKLSGGLVTIMGSDSEQASPKAAKIELSLSGTDEAELRKVFDALAEGGTVNSPLQKQYWGDTFGNLSDKFNIDWMVNIEAPKA